MLHILQKLNLQFFSFQSPAPIHLTFPEVCQKTLTTSGKVNRCQTGQVIVNTPEGVK